MGRPRVLVDGMQLRYGHGAARTIREILPAITRPGLDFDAVVVTSQSAAMMLEGCEVEIVTAPLMPTMAWEQVGLPLYARKVAAAALYSHRSCGPTSGAPTLLHFLDDPQEAAARGATATTPKERIVRAYQRVTVGPALRHASVVATFTQVSADGLRKRFGDALSRVEVVPLGVDATKFYPDPDPAAPQSIFHLGSGEPRDQTELVVQAYAVAAKTSPELPKLVIGGGLGAREGAVRAVSEQGDVADRVSYLGHIGNESDLRGAFSNSAMCVQPSRYESFGLTTLEAIACGAPLLITPEPAVQEVVGSAAAVVEHSNVDALASAMLHLWHNPEERMRLSKLGPERASQFTWVRTGQGVERLLTELVTE